MIVGNNYTACIVKQSTLEELMSRGLKALDITHSNFLDAYNMPLLIKEESAEDFLCLSRHVEDILKKFSGIPSFIDLVRSEILCISVDESKLGFSDFFHKQTPFNPIVEPWKVSTNKGNTNFSPINIS